MNIKPAISRISYTKFWLIIVLFATALSWDYLFGSGVRLDFISFYLAGKIAGVENFYDQKLLAGLSSFPDLIVYPYLYPPFFAYVISPLSRLTIYEAQFIWNAASIALFGFIAILSLKSSETTLGRIGRSSVMDRRPSAFLFALALAAILPFRENINFGQVNIIILFSITASIYLSLKKKDFLSGLVLSLAIIIKLTPALFLIYFLAQRRCSSIIGCISGLAFLMIISLLLGACQSWCDFIEILPSMSYGKTISGLFPASAICNFSFSGYFSRIIGDSGGAVQIMSIIVTVLTALFLYYSTKKFNDGPKAPLLIVLYLIAMVITSPLAYNHHLIYLYPGLVLTLNYFWQNLKSPRKYIIISVVLVFIFLSSFDYPLYYHRISQSEVFSAYFASLNLFAWIFFFIVFYYYIINNVTTQPD